ncbi:MAG: PKD domain-containing protein, partial [Planctomycetes bacterium]|nr:PKD domain-containing protein [Planctomycetota bacterium]
MFRKHSSQGILLLTVVAGAVGVSMLVIGDSIGPGLDQFRSQDSDGDPLGAARGQSWGATLALAADNNPALDRPHLSTGPGPQRLSLLPRGGGGDELYAGDPTCVPLTNDLQVGVEGSFVQACGDGQWVSLAWPVLTGGASIESINLVHNTNTGVGDLYLMGDCGGNPDTNAIMWTGCGCIHCAVSGDVTNYCIGDPIVDPPAIVWVVAVFRNGTFTFDIAFDCLQDGPGHGFANLIGSGNCGDWDDLDNFAHGSACNPGGTFGGCAWVSLVTAAAPGVPPCCDSPAICDGDANGDGAVDPLDSGAILARFGLDASDPGNCQYDVNCDGAIDPLDSGYVLARFGTCDTVTECPLGGGTPGQCGDGCGGPSCPPPAEDCCEVHTSPGCDSVCGELDDGGVEQCVCNVDDFCCNATWDTVCVDLVQQLGCADCSDNNPHCADQKPGGCCLADGACVDVTEADCEILGGSSVNHGLTCADGDCLPAVVIFTPSDGDVICGSNLLIIAGRTDSFQKPGCPPPTLELSLDGENFDVVESDDVPDMDPDGTAFEIDTSDYPSGQMLFIRATTESFEVVHTVLINHQPTTEFQVGGLGTLVEFDASLSEDPDGSIDHFVWDFGDGSDEVVTSEPVIEHQYGLPGTFDVELTACDDPDCCTTFTCVVTVSNDESPTCAPAEDCGCQEMVLTTGGPSIALLNDWRRIAGTPVTLGKDNTFLSYNFQITGKLKEGNDPDKCNESQSAQSTGKVGARAQTFKRACSGGKENCKKNAPFCPGTQTCKDFPVGGVDLGFDAYTKPLKTGKGWIKKHCPDCTSIGWVDGPGAAY